MALTPPPIVSSFSGPAPNRNEPATFSDRTDARLAEWQPNVDEVNAVTAWINDEAVPEVQAIADQAVIDTQAIADQAVIDTNAIAATAQVSADDSQASANASQASAVSSSNSASNSELSAIDSLNSANVSASNANFKGLWADQTGAANIPYSVSHNGDNWQLINNIADVTASEPDISGDWLVIGGSAGTAEQLDYSIDTLVPDSQVISLNPSISGLVVTLTSAAVGDVKRLINISEFDAILSLTGAGLLVIPSGEMAFTFRVGTDWYATLDSNERLASSAVSTGISEIFNNASRDYSVTRLTDSKIVISYSDVSNGNFGTAIVGDISGAEITFGATYVFRALSTLQTSVARLTDTKFAICYKGNSSHGTAIIGDIAGTVITFGVEQVFNAGTTSLNNGNIARLTDAKFAISYKDNGNSSFGTAIVGDVAGTVMTFGAEQVFNAAATSEISIGALTASKIIVSYQDNGNSNFGTAIIGDIAGAAITFGAEQVFNAATTNEQRVSPLTSSKAVLVYESVDVYGKTIVADISGTVITFGDSFPFNTTNNTANYEITRIKDNAFSVIYRDITDGGKAHTVAGVVTGANIEYSEASQITEVDSNYQAVAGINDNEVVLVASLTTVTGTATIGSVKFA